MGPIAELFSFPVWDIYRRDTLFVSGHTIVVPEVRHFSGVRAPNMSHPNPVPGQ